MPLKPAPANHLRLPAIALATVLLGGLAVLGGSVVQQVRMAPSAVPPSMATAKQGARDAGLPVDPSGPAWGELTAAQKRALAPLEQRWSRMGDVQKRRWLALAQTFATLPAQEQDKLHSRMADWASLSAQQRSQARLNYAVTKRLSPDDKRAQWEAYQALSPEEKSRLAAHAGPKPAGAATALHPVSPRKLARIPAATNAPADAVNLPKIPPLPDGKARPALPVPRTDTPVHAAPAAVETAPVDIPSAVATPLPPLEAASAAESLRPLHSPAEASSPLTPGIYAPN